MSNNAPGLRFRRIVRWIHGVENLLLVLLFAGMLVIAGGQIVLRNFFDSGLAWADPFLRVTVLWLALLGALAATRSNKHINIDVLGRLAPQAWQAPIRALTMFFAMVVCGVIAYVSGEFLVLEIDTPTEAFAGIPAWVFEVVIPVSFGLMALRFGIHFAHAVQAVWHRH